jgi:hypothetical protein
LLIDANLGVLWKTNGGRIVNKEQEVQVVKANPHHKQNHNLWLWSELLIVLI